MVQLHRKAIKLKNSHKHNVNYKMKNIHLYPVNTEMIENIQKEKIHMYISISKDKKQKYMR